MESLIRNVGQVSINVQDVKRAIAFYRDVLGLPLLLDVGPFALIGCGHTRLMIGRPEREEFDHPSSTIYLDVEDIHAAVAALKERGVPFEDEPHLIGRLGQVDVWMAFFRDPDGNLLAVQSEVPVQA